MQFSPSGDHLALLGGQRVWVVAISTGNIVANLDLGERHSGFAFLNDSQLYLINDNGALRSLVADRTDNWNLKTVWQGENALSYISVSPNKQHLIIVDDQNRASLLNVKEGRLGSAALDFPGSVRDIVFSPSETRAVIHTARWAHRIGVYPSGLVWLDAIRTPKAISGSKIVFDSDLDGEGEIDPLGDSIVMLSRDTGVAELQFSPTTGSALIGQRERLVEEWKKKLGLND
jgi:hypothetical protein